MPKKIKSGDRFGLLTAVEDMGMQHGYRKWRCRCDCGKMTEVYACHLKSGHTKSCGCRKKEFLKARATDLTGNECITYKETDRPWLLAILLLLMAVLLVYSWRSDQLKPETAVLESMQQEVNKSVSDEAVCEKWEEVAR